MFIGKNSPASRPHVHVLTKDEMFGGRQFLAGDQVADCETRNFGYRFLQIPTAVQAPNRFRFAAE